MATPKKAASAQPPIVKGQDPSRNEEMRWKAEDALRDLTRAEEHRRDPKLMAEVDKMRREKMRALADIKCEVAPKTIKMPK